MAKFLKSLKKSPWKKKYLEFFGTVAEPESRLQFLQKYYTAFSSTVQYICEHVSLQQQPEDEADCGADPDLVLALALSISSAAAATADPPELEQLPPMTAAAAADTSSSSQLLPSSARPTMWLPQPSSALQPFK